MRMNRRVSIWKHVRLANGKWRYCRPVLDEKGKIVADMVTVPGGLKEHHAEGEYCIFFRNPKPTFLRCGSKAADALAAQQRQIALFKAMEHGIVRRPQQSQTGSIEDAVTVFLQELEAKVANGSKRPKTLEAYRQVLREFQGWCADQVKRTLSRLTRLDVIRYAAGVREQSPTKSRRTANTKFVRVNSFLKTNGLALATYKDDRLELSKGGRSLLQGRGEELNTLETEGQMIQRVMPELMGLKNVLVLNDEAHHCYREKPVEDDETDLKGEDRQEAEKNNEAARVWISGLEAVNRKLGVARSIDLSATPFFLRGSGYAEGTLFPWTMSDFSLMDAIECGIVKLPRVPVADNIPGEEMPVFRNLWEHIRGKMPKKGRGKATSLDPLSLPVELQTALEALYGHYVRTYDLWVKQGT